MHVNLSVVPREYVQFAQNYPLVLNKYVVDIRKPAFSNLLIKKGEDYDGPVIVKTKNNYGNNPEKELEWKNRKFLPRYIRKKIHNSGWFRSWKNIDSLKNYPVFESVQEIPPAVWNNKHLIVEKFLPERSEDGVYRVREWVFLGDREIHYINNSHEPVIRGINTFQRDYLAPEDVPADLRKIRTKLGFDFGKFDYVINDNEVVLFDINKTIGTASNTMKRPGAAERIKALSEGLNYYLKN